MFCPNCGKPNQQINSFCRSCGKFLPDFDKVVKREVSPEEHLKVNSVLNLMTAIISLTLSILLYWFFLGKENTPPIIYITAGFLTAICAWQVQTFWRTLLLKKQLKKQRLMQADDVTGKDYFNSIETNPTQKNLRAADFENIAHSSVVENTTRKLDKTAI